MPVFPGTGRQAVLGVQVQGQRRVGVLRHFDRVRQVPPVAPASETVAVCSPPALGQLWRHGCGAAEPAGGKRNGRLTFRVIHQHGHGIDIRFDPDHRTFDEGSSVGQPRPGARACRIRGLPMHVDPVPTPPVVPVHCPAQEPGVTARLRRRRQFDRRAQRVVPIRTRGTDADAARSGWIDCGRHLVLRDEACLVQRCFGGSP